MHRKYKYTTLITASVLAMAAVSATGQIRSDSPRQNVQIAERLMQERSGLYSAIAIAESHTRGVAIAVRLSTDQNQFGQGRSGVQGRDGLEGRTIGHTSDLNENDRQNLDRDRQSGQSQADRDRQQADRDRQTGQSQADRDRQAGQSQGWDSDRQHAQSGPLFAIVTCVVDRSRVRDVIVDMNTNTVVGVQSAQYGSDQQSQYGQRSSDDRDYSSDYDSSSTTAGGFARATDLMNANVRNRAGEKLGDIDDLAIDPDSNHVVYGVLRRGGFLGMGESRYAIPISELTSLQNGRIMVDLDESRFETISGFDNNNWPTRAEAKLGHQGRSTQAADIPAARRIVKASNVIGGDVESRDGRDLGEITDLVVEPRSGRVLYAIVRTDRGHMPVPMASLRKTDDAYSLPMQLDQLRSMPTLDNNRDPNWGDESWNRRIHESFGARFETIPNRDSR